MGYRIEFNDKRARDTVYQHARRVCAARGDSDYTTGIVKENEKILMVSEGYIGEVKKHIAMSRAKHTLTRLVSS